VTLPERRRDAIDVARVLALLLVVAGHLLLAVIDRRAGHLRGANLIALHPGLAGLAALSPMPVFFAAAGWANATSTFRGAAARLRSLVGTAALVVGVWSLGVVVATAVAGDPGVVGDGARIATQPIWFLAAYVPFAAGGALMARLATIGRGALIVVAVVVLAGVDLARFELSAPAGIGWLCFYLAWSVPWLLGCWWRDRATRGGTDERRVGLLLAAGGGIACVVLVQAAGYSPALIDAVRGARSNTTPPTLYTATAGIAQVGGLMLLAGVLDAVGRRWRSLWDRAGSVAVGVYLWHLSALALCAAVVALGLPVPERLTPGWWLTRPAWIAAVLGVTAGLVALTAWGRARLARPRPAPVWSATRATAGVVGAAAGAALVGLRGPRTDVLAVTCSVLLGGAWWLLRGVPAPMPSAPGSSAPGAGSG
jgi:hypothetical protein